MKRWYWIVAVLILMVATLVIVFGQRSTEQKSTDHKQATKQLKSEQKLAEISEDILQGLTPDGYAIKKWVKADINQDKRPDLVLACEAKDLKYDGEGFPPAKILVFADKNGRWQEIWNFQENIPLQGYVVGRRNNISDKEPVLTVEDINKDGLVELIFSLTYYYGASGGTINTHIYNYQKDRFVSLLEKPLGHDRNGGVMIDDKKICLYGEKWSDGEASFDSHRYKVKVFQWDGNKYVKKQEFITQAKGDAGRKEVSQNFQRIVQGKPIIVKKPAEPELMAGLYKDSTDIAIKADLKKRWKKTKSPQYILDDYDRRCFQSGQEDIRVLKMLEELTKNKGHILAVRVKSGHPKYDSMSRESDPGWQNISPHSTAQAFDIFYADKVEIGWQASKDGEVRYKAEKKIRQLMKEILEIGRRNSNLLPTQLCVYKKGDILAFNQEAQALYGGYPPDTGLRGMMVGDRYWDRIHVGY